MVTRPRLILVVEDESSLRELIANILLLDHHEVDTVRDGAEALYRIEQRAYDLIISDLQMPNLDGPGLYAALRKRFGESLPRVIFVTGHAEADQFVPFPARTPAQIAELGASDLGTELEQHPDLEFESYVQTHFRRIYPGWKKFRDEQFQWFRVAESTYDNYMMNSKVGQPGEKTAAKKS